MFCVERFRVSCTCWGLAWGGATEFCVHVLGILSYGPGIWLLPLTGACERVCTYMYMNVCVTIPDTVTIRYVCPVCTCVCMYVCMYVYVYVYVYVLRYVYVCVMCVRYYVRYDMIRT